VLVEDLWLKDWRVYEEASVSLAPGLTAVIGENAAGKTSLLEAVGWLTSLSSFRGAPTEALVRTGAPSAVVRARGSREGRELLLEAELVPTGRDRVQVNRQPLRRSRDLLGALRSTVFSPDDLSLVKGGPSERRRYLDGTLVATDVRMDELVGKVDRALRQRNALLRQAGGRLDDSARATLDVWDQRLGADGELLAEARYHLAVRLAPELARAYGRLAGDEGDGDLAATAEYAPAWSKAAGGPGLEQALGDARKEDVRRGVTTVGPHRDELELAIAGRAARTHASQGEQRSLAVALRLASHFVVTAAAGSPPILLLDDVLSELDPGRSSALMGMLPPGQALLTTAGPLPSEPVPERVLVVERGRLREAA
jgi:DNA replication and repair protein RecF